LQGLPTEGSTETKPAADQPAAAKNEPKESTPATAESAPPETKEPEPSPKDESQSSGRLVISPIAARMAAEGGVDLKSLAGSGPGGRIIKRDVEAAIDGGKKAPEASRSRATSARTSAAPQQQAAITGASPYRDVPLS